MVELALVLVVDETRREFKLLAGGPPIVVGRGADATLRVDLPLFSRRHFEVRYHEERGVELLDLKSANGTFVNGQLVQQTTLRPGDVIRVGGTTFKVDFEADDVPTAPRSDAWIADAASGELRCQRCGRLISMSTVGDDQTFEWSDQVLCPACKEGSSMQDTGVLAKAASSLQAEGFEVLGRLSAEGVIAPLFRARRKTGLGDLVAIKILPLVPGISQKKIERFKAEAQSMAQIKHENVVRVYDVRERPDLIFIVMELIEGETLLKKIERSGKVEVVEALGIALAISRALEAAAAQGIVHRNVKPANIILSSDGTPKLVDFGIAKGVKSFRPDITNEEETLGTIRYMPPEQVHDAREANARSDIYALAATLFHALTGKLPYPTHSELDLLKHVVSGKLPDFIIAPTEPIPPPVAHVLMRALKKKPDDRYPTPGKFREALVQAIYSVTEGRALLSAEERASIPESTAALAEPQPGAMRGAFDEQHPLSEIVQMLGINSKTGNLVVTAPGGGGELHFQDGRIVESKTASGVTGEPAAHLILRTPAGQWEYTPLLPSVFKPRFNRSVEGLVLESLRADAKAGEEKKA